MRKWRFAPSDRQPALNERRRVPNTTGGRRLPPPYEPRCQGSALECSEMPLLLNILWIAFGGLWMAAAWLLAAVIMALTIVGIPWARAAANIALYTLLPFGHTAIDREEFTGRPSIGTGPLGVIGNLVWFLFAGWWLALGHLITAFALAVTIIGLPFAWAHLKLAGIALWPIGKVIVSLDEAQRPWRSSKPLLSH